MDGPTRAVRCRSFDALRKHHAGVTGPTPGRRPAGRLHGPVPLTVLVTDGGVFYRRLTIELGAFDTRLQMEAPFAFGLPDLPPEVLAAAERARQRSAQLLDEGDDDPVVRLAAERHVADARELLHEAQVMALRAQRADLLATRGATLGGTGT